MYNQKGFTLIETLVALAILGILASVFLSGLVITTDASIDNDERATADSLVRAQMEYIRTCTYQYDVSEYAVNPTLSIPAGWEIPPSTVEKVHASDDGIQKVTVSARHLGNTVLVVTTYKVDR
jgi:prepilin-type N-terminal cleavage/methylation domain-containing protein